MLITEVRITPLFIPYRRPFVWAGGRVEGATVILIEIECDSGHIGFGEALAAPWVAGVAEHIKFAARYLVGGSPFDSAYLMNRVYRGVFQNAGNGSAPRFAAKILAGLEMALWDLVGRATGRPIHQLLGGAVRSEIRYFGFAQGGTADEIASDAARLVDEGFEVVYIKVGRGDNADLVIVEEVRKAIGGRPRLRVDANESWCPATFRRMASKMVEFGVELIEQPTPSQSIDALGQARLSSPIAIAADQAVFTAFDAFSVCCQKAADLIVIGLHETGGVRNFLKVAHVAEAAGLNVCLHGLSETGITTSAMNQVGATVTNLDDANQIMNQFLEWDLVEGSGLVPVDGKLSVLNKPGLGFELNWNAVERAKEAYFSILREDGSLGGESF